MTPSAIGIRFPDQGQSHKVYARALREFEGTGISLVRIAQPYQPPHEYWTICVLWEDTAEDALVAGYDWQGGDIIDLPSDLVEALFRRRRDVAQPGKLITHHHAKGKRIDKRGKLW